MQAPKKEPAILFIFGGSGDLTYRKLMPALYNLFLDKYLPEQFRIISIGRSDFSNTTYRNYIKKGIAEHSRRKDCLKIAWKEFSELIEYYKADLESEKTYRSIASYVKDYEDQWKAKATEIYYMSIAPQLAPTVAERLHSAKLMKLKTGSGNTGVRPTCSATDQAFLNFFSVNIFPYESDCTWIQLVASCNMI